MFLHQLKYAYKCMLKNKTSLVWTLIFPIALATFMYIAFGNLYEKENIFHDIPVAVVKESDNEALIKTLEALSGDEDALLAVEYLNEDEALNKLSEKEIEAIIYESDEVHMTVYSSGYNTSIVQMILDEYIQSEAIIKQVMTDHPENVFEIISKLTSSSRDKVFKETNISSGNTDFYSNFFYAIFAMSCLFASFTACEKTQQLLANFSPLGVRRGMIPGSKLTTLMAEFIAMLSWQFLTELVAFGYMTAIGVKLGTHIFRIMLVLLMGSSIGISIGVLIGSIKKGNVTSKNGICIAVSMAFSVMADLCVAGIKNSIEQAAPILNRINPAVLISDSIYALNVFDNFDRYNRNVIILAVMTIVLLITSAFILRRNKYVHL